MAEFSRGNNRIGENQGIRTSCSARLAGIRCVPQASKTCGKMASCRKPAHGNPVCINRPYPSLFSYRSNRCGKLLECNRIYCGRATVIKYKCGKAKCNKAQGDRLCFPDRGKLVTSSRTDYYCRACSIRIYFFVIVRNVSSKHRSGSRRRNSK